MNTKVVLILGDTGKTQEFTFERAQNILRVDKYNSFKIAEPTKFKFINNELIKQPSTKSSKKPTKKGGSTTGGEVPK